ncbi:MAG TPA: DEAD/DEAH box helicase [Bacteroidetes bacterium]|nr:DEAD/DEAH box helicase [Bacteroidota bacterium]
MFQFPFPLKNGTEHIRDVTSKLTTIPISDTPQSRLKKQNIRILAKSSQTHQNLPNIPNNFSHKSTPAHPQNIFQLSTIHPLPAPNFPTFAKKQNMRERPVSTFASQPTAIVFNIHRYLPGGWYLPDAWIVKTGKGGQLTFVVQRATLNTIGSYGHELTPVLTRLFSLIEALSEKVLEEKYQPPRSRKKKPLVELLQDAEVKKTATRYVHRLMANFLEKVVEQNLPLTFMVQKKVIVEDVKLRFPEEGLKPHLIFRRTRDGVRYRMNFSTGDERWLVRERRVVPLTNIPGWLLANGALYRLPELNGYWVKPFMQKDEIVVPNRMLRTYFQKFILKAVEKTEIEAEGFDLTSTRKLESCHLALSKHPFKNKWFAALKFQYQGALFQWGDRQEMRTALHFESETEIRVMQVKRSPEREQQAVDKLKKMGFENREGSLWRLPGGAGQGNGGQDAFHEAAECLSALRYGLQAAGFQLEAPVFEDKKINLLPAAWSQEVVQENDWFDLRIVIKAGQFEFPFAKLISYIRDSDRFYPLPDGTFFLIPAEWMARFHGLAHLGKLSGGKLRLSKSQKPLLEKLGLAEGADFTKKEETPFQVPKLLKATLRPYQKEGAEWLFRHYEEGLGACLADDMGLGKTIQTLTILLTAKEGSQSAVHSPPQMDLFGEVAKGGDFVPLKALVILPASLVFNWEREVKKFAPGLTICNHTGPKRTKDARLLERYDLVFTTYQTARRDLVILQKIKWEYVVLDESQYIKNPQSGVFKAVGELDAAHRISLSGTPIENSLSDLWAQMEFLNPGMLGSFNYFKKHFIRPIEKRDDEVKKDELRRLVKPYLLRRTKEEVEPDLPPLTEAVVYVEMTEAQRKFYEKEKSAARNKLLNISDPSQPTNKVAILAALTRLRQIANHPSLVQSASEIPNTHNTLIPNSGKFEDVLAYWDKIRRSGHKALIFSSFEKYLQLFRSHFEEAGHAYTWLTGKVAAAQRKKAVDRFNDDKSVQAFFMTTKAGGVGLNLNAADYVFVLDPWWNPFAENQAIARAHRIGQEKKVMAVKFIARDSIEEKILQMQERKSALAGEFVASPEKMACTREGLEALLL